MGQVKVSVIVPVYNVEKYLDQTLTCITGQTLKEIEIICVDDGSTDSSLAILEKWAAKDTRLSVLHQQNEFAGAARNRGMDAASGEFFVFWDSDDMFEPKALETMYRRITEEEADICVCAARRYDDVTGRYIDTDGYLKINLLPEKTVFNKDDVPDYLFDIASNHPWNKMYHRSFVEKNHLRFQVIRQANDTCFVMMAMALAERITWVEDVLVSYRTNVAGSITGSSSSSPLCVCEAYAYTKEKLTEAGCFGQLEAAFCNHALQSFYNVLNNQKKFASYQVLYDALADHVLADLGLTDLPEEKYLVAWRYRDMQKILSMPAGDFLLQKAEERRLNVEREKAARKKVEEDVLYQPRQLYHKIKRRLKGKR